MAVGAMRVPPENLLLAKRYNSRDNAYPFDLNRENLLCMQDA
jgi:hypothetical protein